MKADGSVVRFLLDRAPMSDRGASAALGHAPSWARTTALPGRSPQLATVADVADLAGVDVVLVDRATGERVAVVDPPRRATGPDATDPDADGTGAAG